MGRYGGTADIAAKLHVHYAGGQKVEPRPFSFLVSLCFPPPQQEMDTWREGGGTMRQIKALATLPDNVVGQEGNFKPETLTPKKLHSFRKMYCPFYVFIV